MKPEHKKNILFTRNINEQQMAYAKQYDFDVEHHSFIQIKWNKLSRDQLENINKASHAAWVFTSQNAVKCFAQHLDSICIPEHVKCYAVGNKTAEALQQINMEAIVPSVHNSLALVDLLEEENNKAYLYFSGNLRQNILTQFFEEKEIPFQEIECYQTLSIQPDIDLEKYDAICFCSPSAVNSFFQNHQLDEQIPCIAIGNTTAVHLLNFTEHVVMAEQTNIYSMLDMCNEYINS